VQNCPQEELKPKERTVSDDFKPGLEGVIAFESEIAEPDKEGSALRYRGVDIDDLVGRVSFGNVSCRSRLIRKRLGTSC